MDKYELTEKLKELIGAYLEGRGLELVDLLYRFEGRDLFLRVLVDTPEGNISIGECASLNKEIGVMLDEQGILNENHILEVFSPGLDRPLYAKNDFSRCKNRLVKVFLKEMVDGKLEWDGIILKVENDAVFIDVKGNILELPFEKINKAKQLIGE